MDEPGALGDVVDVGPGPLQANPLSLKGKKGLLESGGDAVFAVIIPVGDVAGFVSCWRGEDARVLPVAWVHNRRHTDWPDAARKSRQEDFADFPIGKPRTARWCADNLVKDGGPAPRGVAQQEAPAGDGLRRRRARHAVTHHRVPRHLRPVGLSEHRRR